MPDPLEIARSIEHTPTGHDKHVHNFSDIYQQLSQLQTQDGGPHSARFQQDLQQINEKLHDDGVLPNLQLQGIDGAGHILTRNIADNKNVAQNAESVNDFGGLDTSNARQMRDQMLARALGVDVSRNGDGSYNVAMPDANAATGSILNTVMKGLLGGGKGGAAPFGMNPLLAQAWTGWEEKPEQ